MSYQSADKCQQEEGCVVSSRLGEMWRAHSVAMVFRPCIGQDSRGFWSRVQNRVLCVKHVLREVKNGHF